MTKKKPQDPFIGKTLGDYKLTSVLATGGMARIYVGKDINLGREAAVKVLTQEMIESDSFLRERFLREARAVAVLDHPNIIPIFQYGEEEDFYFLVMKLVRGRDFADEIGDLQRQGERMTIKRMLHILSQTAAALDAAHEAGIIHRDVKPSNILLEEETDRAILTDFGLVLQQTEIDKTMGTAFGTPRYISPEQALASESVVPQSDIYSLGVIVYEIVTGSQVFRADTAMQIALSHISEPPPAPTTINPDISKAVEREILKALEKEPENRHQTAMEFVEALAAAYGEELDMPTSVGTRSRPAKPTASPQATAPAGSSPPAEKAGSSRTLLFGGIGAVILLAIIGLLVLGGGGGDDDNDAPDSEFGGTVVEVEAIEPVVAEVVTGEAQPLTANYNGSAFALVNTAEVPVSLIDFQAERSGALSLEGTRDVNGQRLESGECLLVVSATTRVEIPEDWNCTEVRNEIVRYPESLFFREASDTFGVTLPDETVVDCPTTIDSAQTCDLSLPAIVTSDE
jgi:tRNA A-37 threonylcarbamoyl transferase component Bud32